MAVVELLVAAVILVLSVVLVYRAWVARRRRGELRGSITEVQARENAAPLSTAILATDRRERPSS